jgi:hypothetical protein
MSFLWILDRREPFEAEWMRNDRARNLRVINNQSKLELIVADQKSETFGYGISSMARQSEPTMKCTARS